MKAKLVKEAMEDRVSSRGEKTDTILQFIADAGPEGRRYTDIIKFAYEYTHGEGSYTREKRGYWSGGFKTPSPDDRGFGHLMKYIQKNKEGRWILRDEVMTSDEEDFHGGRISHGNAKYRPDLYKKEMKWKNPKYGEDGNFRPHVGKSYYDSELAAGRDVSGMDYEIKDLSWEHFSDLMEQDEDEDSGLIRDALDEFGFDEDDTGVIASYGHSEGLEHWRSIKQTLNANNVYWKEIELTGGESLILFNISDTPPELLSAYHKD